MKKIGLKKAIDSTSRLFKSLILGPDISNKKSSKQK